MFHRLLTRLRASRIMPVGIRGRLFHTMGGLANLPMRGKHANLTKKRVPSKRTRGIETRCLTPCSIAIARSHSRGDILCFFASVTPLEHVQKMHVQADCNHGFLSIRFFKQLTNITVIIIKTGAHGVLVCPWYVLAFVWCVWCVFPVCS